MAQQLALIEGQIMKKLVTDNRETGIKIVILADGTMVQW